MKVKPAPLASAALRTSVALVAVVVASPALAQDMSENRAWQFETPQEVTARAAILDLIARQRTGAYAAPIYNTTIARQYVCSVAATATGNQSTQSALANSPTVTGTAAIATGNADATEVGSDGQPVVSSDQRNDGPIRSSAAGPTTVPINGAASPAMRSSQSNGGAQSASVQGSTACGFGILN